MSLLNNKDRCSYIEALRPDPGFRVEYIIGTTYSLEMDTLLMSSLSLCLETPEDVNYKVADPISLLQSCRKLQEVSVILYEPGEIRNRHGYNQLYYFLEQSLYSVEAPEGGVFHPKVWFLKYVNGEEERFRFLCLSRNMTFDTSWDFVLSLHGERVETQDPEGKILSKFFKEIRPKDMSEAHKGIYDRAIEDLKYVSFEAPKGTRLSFHPLGIKGADIPFNADEYERQCIVSPFLSTSIAEHDYAQKENIIISMAHELDCLKKDDFKRFNEVYVIDEKLFDFPDDDPKKETYQDVGDDLHAKLYFFERGKKAWLFAGSANATEAAFERNVEFLVGLEGNVNTLGIDQFLGEDQFGFKSILTGYEQNEPDEEEVQKKKNSLKLLKIKKALFGSKVSYEYSQYDQVFTLNLKVEPSEELKKLSNQFQMKVGLSTKPHEMKDLINGKDAEFSLLSLEDLTSLFLFEVKLVDCDATDTYMQKVAGSAFPKLRSDSIIRNAINSTDKFLRFLHLMLHGHEIGSEILRFIDEKRKKGGEGSNQALYQVPLFEEILQSLARSPDKLQSIGSVLEGLDDKEGKIVPPEFAEIWERVKEAKRLIYG